MPVGAKRRPIEDCHARDPSKREHKPQPEETASPPDSHSAFLPLWELASLISVWLIIAIVDPGQSNLMLIICTVVVVLTNLLVAMQFRNVPAAQ